MGMGFSLNFLIFFLWPFTAAANKLWFGLRLTDCSYAAAASTFDQELYLLKKKKICKLVVNTNERNEDESGG